MVGRSGDSEHFFMGGLRFKLWVTFVRRCARVGEYTTCV